MATKKLTESRVLLFSLIVIGILVSLYLIDYLISSYIIFQAISDDISVEKLAVLESYLTAFKVDIVIPIGTLATAVVARYGLRETARNITGKGETNDNGNNSFE